jgi:hypothetical protein
LVDDVSLERLGLVAHGVGYNYFSRFSLRGEWSGRADDSALSERATVGQSSYAETQTLPRMNARKSTMSIRCSLLGHDYGDTETEREREEQGSEVVVTVREFEECERCGERKIVSENKEVTSIASPAPDLEAAEADESADAGPGAGGSAGTGQSSGASTDADAGVTMGTGSGTRTGGTTGTGGAGVPDEAVPAGGDDAEIIDDSTDDGTASAGSSGRSATGGGDPSAAGGSDPNAAADAPSGGRTGGTGPRTDAGSGVERDFEESPADDDAEILEGGASGASDGTGGAEDRTPGEWPDAETTHPAEAEEKGPGDWPSVGQEDEGYDAEPDNGASADVEFGGGLTPESSPEVDDDESEEVEFVNASGDTLGADDTGRSGGSAGSNPELSSGISAGAEAPSLSGPSDDPDLDAEFVCPECDYREEVSGSSLRAGDICPDCGRGYLAQQ